MTSFAALQAEDRRLHILKLLADSHDESVSDEVMCDALSALSPHNVSRDLVRTDYAWLAEQGVVSLEQVREFTVATLTRRGADFLARRCVVPGIKRPRKGD